MKPIITKTLVLFTLVQVAALLIGLEFAGQNVSVVENPASAGNSLYLFTVIIAFALILLIILKLYKGKLLFLLLELAMEFTAAQLFTSLFTSEAIPTLVALAVVAIRISLPQSRQLFLIATIAIVGGLLGASLDLLPAVLLAALLAVYDVAAVFYTKHMISLATELSKRQAAFSIKITAEKDKLELGTGDLVIPAMLIVSANRIGKTALHLDVGAVSFPAILGIVGATAGIAALLFYLQRKKGYWPALPPITAGTIAGILIASVF